MWDMSSSAPIRWGMSSEQRLSLAELSALSDEQLMANLKAGCNDALAVLFRRYRKLVLSIALKIVRDPAEAEDVTQVVFLEIFRTVAQFDPSKSTTKVWILQYAYHRSIDRRQQLSRRNFYNSTDVEEIDNLIPGATPGYGRFTEAELKHLVQQGLATLNNSQRRVIELASYSGLSMKEIAEKTGDSLANVRHYYYRGLQKLRSFVLGTGEAKSA